MTYGILALSAFDLSLHEVLGNLPHDLSSVLVYALLGSFVWLIWYGSRESTIKRHRSNEGSDPAVTTSGGLDSPRPGQHTG